MPSSEAPNASAAPAPSESSRGLHALFLVVLIAIGATVRFHSLAAKPFWFDECFSTELARIGWRSFFRLLWWREANMSLYYVLFRIWLAFVPVSAQSQFFIRSLSVVFACATVPAIYWLGKLLYDRRTGLISAALFALNIYSIRYSQEARSYALFVLLATLSSGFLISFLREPTRRRRNAYVLCSILAVYAHLYALLLLAAHWIAIRIFRGPSFEQPTTAERPIRSAAISGNLRRAWQIIGIAVLPLLIFVAKTGAGPIRWIPRPGLEDLLLFAIYFTNGLPIVYLCACLIALIPVRKNLLARNQAWDGWRAQFLFVWLLFPILLTVALSFARPVFLPRYMIFCLPALVILAGAGLAAMRPPWLSAALAFLVVLLSAKIVPFIYTHDFDDERDASVAAASFIFDQAQPGDAIVFHIAEARVAYEFVRSARTAENSASPDFTRQFGPGILFPTHGPGLSYLDFTGKPTPDLLLAAGSAHPRLWLMLMYNQTASHPDATTDMLDRTLPAVFPKVRRSEYSKVEVRLYSRQ